MGVVLLLFFHFLSGLEESSSSFFLLFLSFGSCLGDTMACMEYLSSSCDSFECDGDDGTDSRTERERKCNPFLDGFECAEYGSCAIVESDGTAAFLLLGEGGGVVGGGMSVYFGGGMVPSFGGGGEKTCIPLGVSSDGGGAAFALDGEEMSPLLGGEEDGGGISFSFIDGEDAVEEKEEEEEEDGDDGVRVLLLSFPIFSFSYQKKSVQRKSIQIIYPFILIESDSN